MTTPMATFFLIGANHRTAPIEVRERLALSVMYLVTRAFATGGKRYRIATLADELAVPSVALGPVDGALLLRPREGHTRAASPDGVPPRPSLLRLFPDGGGPPADARVGLSAGH